jgi:hypothetical protein
MNAGTLIFGLRPRFLMLRSALNRLALGLP